MTFDIIIILFTVVLGFSFFKKGLIRSILLAFSNLIAFFSAYIVAKRYSLEISENFVLDTFRSYIDKYIIENLDLNSILESLSGSISQVDDSIANFFLNMSPSDINHLLHLKTSDALSFLSDNIAQSISYGFTYVVIFILSLIIVSIALKFVINFIDFVLNITLLSPINRILGGLLGVFVALFISGSLIWTIMTVLPLTTMDDGVFSKENVKDTYVLKHIVDNRPNIFTNFIK